MGDIDIKALARQLKKEGSQHQEIVGNQITPLKRTTTKKPKKTSFNQLISELNNRKDFNCIGGVYIDEDLHELLRQLKLRKKLKIGNFVSWLIEQYVVEHQDEISTAVRRKQNKYL